MSLLIQNGNINTLTLSDASLMTVIKREGNIVPYDISKIERAVCLCFDSVSFEKKIVPRTDQADQIVRQVDTILRLKSSQLSKDGKPAPIGIESIQDIVESQLMAIGYFDAAKHYILYRDDRRRVREEKEVISSETKQLFKDGSKYFTGTNRLLQEVQAFDKFSRFQSDLGRREVWSETCDRVMNYYKRHVNKIAPGSIPEETWNELHQGLLHHQAAGSLRGVQMSGPALDRCQSGLFNCSFLIMDSPEAAAEDLYLSMQGCGVGFSVEEEYAVDKWPKVKAQRGFPPLKYTVEDDTESWCDASKFNLETLLDGGDVIFDLSPIRKKGSLLKIKGGRASGPEVLRDLLNFQKQIILRRQRMLLRSIDIHDMTCMSHRIGQMGGVRRASGLSMSGLNDHLMRHAKDGAFFEKYPWRDQANNSAAYETKPSSIEFMEEWLSLAKSGSGERGIFNRGSLQFQIPKRRQFTWLGTNPCLVGDTPVWVADGRGSVTIKQLVEEGTDIPVFCMDSNFKLQIRYMRNPRITGYQEPILKVTLDDGSYIRVTRNHKFLLKDKTFCEAQYLRPDMRLRLITRYTPESVNPQSESRADRYIYAGCGGDSYFEHVKIAEFNAGRKILQGEHAHHRDENKLNNSPDNIVIQKEFDNLSYHSDKSSNPNSKGISNDQLIIYGRNLCKSLDRRFSIGEWVEFANLNGLPQTFSDWRGKSLGSIMAFSKRCSILEGMGDFSDLDPKVIKTYKSMVSMSLDAEIIDGKVFIHKKCEGCKNPFTVVHTRREICFCSVKCSKIGGESDDVKKKRLKNQADAFDSRRKELREKQITVYKDLLIKLKREPQKKEWVAECQIQGVSTEIRRQSSPFISWKSLKEAGICSNHRVVSIEDDGYEDVYNGTVDDFHNFCVGGWDGGLTSKGRRRQWWIINAQCGEIYLRNKGFCNLSIAIVNVIETVQSLVRKIRLATIWGTIQSTMTDFKYISPEWKKNAEEERLLGVDILGHMDCKLLKPGAVGREDLMNLLKNTAIEENVHWAKRLGINPSVAITCGKPGGDSSVFFDKQAGLKPHHGKHSIRRLRFEDGNPVAKVLKDAGIPWERDYNKTNMFVFEFPCKAPDDAIVLGDMTAIEQLENWKTWKVNYTEHNPSCTISVKNDEWIRTGNWVYENWDIVGGLSFYPYDDSVYPLAPYEAISEEEYRQRMETMPREIDWSRLLIYEKEDHTTLSSAVACFSGSCEIS